MDICKQIANKRQQQLDAEQEKRDALAKNFTVIMREFRKKLPKLREAERIFRSLQENNFTMSIEEMHLDREDHYKKGYFLSDGWYHWPGFSKNISSVYFTCGGGICRFSCGIHLVTGRVLVNEREFGTPSTALTDQSVKTMCKKGGYFSTNPTGQGHYYQLTGREVVEKLKYCLDEADRFCARVTEFAQHVVNG